MTAPLARYLKDFSSAPPPVVAPAMEDTDFGDAFGFEPTIEAAPAIDIDAERAAAYEEGKAEGERAAAAAFAAEREQLEAEHAEAIAALRAQLEGDAVARLEGQIRGMRDALAMTLEDLTAAALAPVLHQALATKAAEELADMVRDALSSQEVTRLTVQGPLDMFEKFRDALGAEAPELRHIENDDLDLSVDIEESVLVTRLSAWAGSVKKVLG
ncbi:hypothetical protein ACFSE1_11100 [Rhizobium helianthi]|uniref:GTPase n=1 Tax=Rhizobium helianthi TaxID=1132695 RepID=A0ABW4M648_9HYPH